MSTRAVKLRSLPSVDRLLRHPDAVALLARYPRQLLTETVREVLDQTRGEIAGGRIDAAPGDATLVQHAAARLAAGNALSLGPVINASGVVLHTNLGRALLATDAVAAVTAVATQPSNLEYDLARGRRGDRDKHIEAQLRALTGAEAATAVNNNAAAVLLGLNTLAQGREVIVSRGELIEIGGSFRIPEILDKSGAILREVGTTNRTHLSDYERAIGAQTALLLKVHPSNYRIEGFAAEVPLGSLVELGRIHHIPVMEDLGSGALIDLSAYGVPREPVVAERVQLGADVVTFSGDKLLGGPQAGILVGRSAVIDRMRHNPLKRALRCDKLTLAALDATLRLYRSAPDLVAALPTLRMLARPMAEMEALACDAMRLLRSALGADYRIEVSDAESEIGSGALPTRTLPTKAIVISHPVIAPLDIAAHFRASSPPIIGRVHEGRFWLDLRCIWQAEQLVPGPGPLLPGP